MQRDDWKIAERRLTLIAASALVIVSALAFYLLSHLDEGTAGVTRGNIATVLVSVWLLSQISLAFYRLKEPSHQLWLMGISFIQVVPFLFAAVYGAFGYKDICVVGARAPADMLYFSYVTFTTVGFGDLRPAGLCRGIAVAEAVTGYILLGLFVSAAIARHGQQRRAG